MPSQEDVIEQKKLLQVYRRTLAHYLEQQAIHGTAYVPPSVVYGINEARESIWRIKTILRSWGVVIEDHPDDLPSTIANPEGIREEEAHKQNVLQAYQKHLLEVQQTRHGVDASTSKETGNLTTGWSIVAVQAKAEYRKLKVSSHNQLHEFECKNEYTHWWDLHVPTIVKWDGEVVYKDLDDAFVSPVETYTLNFEITDGGIAYPATVKLNMSIKWKNFRLFISDNLLYSDCD